MDNLSEIIEKIKAKKGFENWFKGNKLNPYKSQDDAFPMLAYHGSFINEPIKKIDTNKNAEFIHGAKGLYLSTSNKEVSEYYTDFENKNADVHYSIEEMIENPYELIKRFSIDFLCPKIQNEPYFEDTEEVLEWCRENITDRKFKKIFLMEKEEYDQYSIDEIITKAYLKSNGVIFPFIVKMENPLYCIEENYANNHGLKSTILKVPESDSNGMEKYIKEIIEDSENEFFEFCNIFNLDGVEKEELIEVFSGSFWDYETVVDYLSSYIDSLDREEFINIDIEDKIKEIFVEDGMFSLSTSTELIEAENNYIKFMELLHELSDFEFDEINKIMSENMDIEEGEYGNYISVYKLLKASNELMLKKEVEGILSKIYDGFVYSANSEFQYVKENYSDQEPIFHYVVNNDKNLKYAYNATFQKHRGVMFRKVLGNESGSHLEIGKIKNIIKGFEKKYNGFPKVNICDYSSDNVAKYDKENKEITIYKNNIRKEEDLIKTLYHEYVIHGKIDKYLKGKDKGFLLEVYNYIKDKEDFKKIKNFYDIDNPKSLKEKKYLAEEYLAYAAENKLYKKDKIILGFFEKLKALVSKFKKSISIDNTNDRVSLMIDKIDGDLRNKKINKKVAI